MLFLELENMIENYIRQLGSKIILLSKHTVKQYPLAKL